MGDAGSPVATEVAVDLSHLALSVARFFSTMELAHDAGPLTRLGSGRLRLDLLRRLSRHGERWVPFPHIGDILRHRIGAALQSIEQPLAWLSRAELEADVRLQNIPRPAGPGARSGWAGDDGPLIQVDLTVTVHLANGAGQWNAQHKGQTTWPESWGRKP